MQIIFVHCYDKMGPHIEVAKRDNGSPALFTTRAAAESQAARWNRKMKNIGLISNRYYHSYEIND